MPERPIFDFSYIEDPKLAAPRVYIALRGYVKKDFTVWPILSADIISEEEVDEAIADLKLNLDRAAKEAKAAIRRIKRRENIGTASPV